MDFRGIASESAVQHEQLWAPWRLAYVTQDAAQDDKPTPRYEFLPNADESCFICQAVAARSENGHLPDRDHLLAFRGENCCVILNRFPYNNGHLLIAPNLHKGRLEELSAQESIELHVAITRYVAKLERLMNAQGFNIGLNLGRAAGAGLPGHLHWHVVPRWSGDTNFMGVLGGVEVIPQALDALWTMLKEDDDPAFAGGMSS